MSKPKPTIAPAEAGEGNVKTYSIGFALSIVLTIVAYVLTVKHSLSGWTLIYVLAGLAIAQLFVQLYFFLHLGRESKPRWNLTVFAFALMVVVILVFGSLWIMKNLDYGHNMPVNQSSQHIIQDEGYTPSKP